MRLWRFRNVLFMLIILVSAATVASAEPAAKVKTFVNGHGLSEFMGSIGSETITCISPSNEGDDTAVVIVPNSEGSVVAVYEAVMNDEFEILPNRNELLADTTAGQALLFWCIVPEGIPNTVVVVTDEKGKEYHWSPAFSGFDGSLVTNDDFVPLDSD